MAEFSQQDAVSALNLLAEVSLRHEQEIANYSANVNQNMEDDLDSNSPYFDEFYNEGGAKAIKELTNFYPAQFEEIWLIVQEFITKNYNSGRGKRCKVSGKDILLMLMTVLKHGGQWDLLGRIFNIKGPTFERMITRFA